MRGLEEVAKLHRMRCVAYNLGLLLRKVFGMVKPRSAGAVAGAFIGVLTLICAVIGIGTTRFITVILGFAFLAFLHVVVQRQLLARIKHNSPKSDPSLTGC